MSGRAIAYELLCEEILCFAILALGPGSRSPRARALAALARDTRIACPGRATPDALRTSTTDPSTVMRGLDPRIHLLRKNFLEVRWIAGSSPAMTICSAATADPRITARVRI